MVHNKPLAGRMRLPRLLSYVLYLVAAVLLAIEGLNGFLWIAGCQTPDAARAVWIIEASPKPAVCFDPHSGFRYGQEGTRHALIASDYVDYQARLRGNNLGFPDAQDFTPTRQHPERPRIAVLGDSFTAGVFMETNWPDRVEELAATAGRPVELLNFSLDGAGAANWWGIATHLLKAQRYELDGLVLALFNSNHSRNFIVADHHGRQCHMSGYVDSWTPEEWPKTLEEAQPYLRPLPGYIVPSEVFERALKGDLRGIDAQNVWRPVAPQLYRFFRDRVIGRAAAAENPTLEEQGSWRLLADIAAYAKASHIKTLILRIPHKGEILNNMPASEDMQRCAQLFEAALMDGAAAFEGLTAVQVDECYFRYDGHWNQRGSDRFAHHMLETFMHWNAAPLSNEQEKRP